MNTYVLLVCQTYFVFCIYTNNFGNCTHVYNAHDVISWQPHVLYICKPYLFCPIYYSWGIPCFTVIFVFANAYTVFTVIHKHFTFGSYICSFTSITTYGFFVWQTYISFSLFMPKSFEIVHSVHIYKILMNLKCYIDNLIYLTSLSNICSF